MFYLLNNKFVMDLKKITLLVVAFLSIFPVYAQEKIDYWCENQLIRFCLYDNFCEVMSYNTVSGDVYIPEYILYSDKAYPVTSINGDAFSGCSTMTSVTIPKTVKRIDTRVFLGCDGLKAVHISDLAAWCEIDFRSFYRFPDTSYGSNPLESNGNPILYLNGNMVTDLVIPDSVTSIGEYAFIGYEKLASVKISDSVTSIGDYAFYGCSNLTSVVIPESVTSIGDYAFYGCSNLTSVVIPESVTSIGNSAFYECDNLTTLYYNAKKCEGFSFISAKGLKNLVIGDSVTYIPFNAFRGCTNLNILYFNAVNCERCGEDPFPHELKKIIIGDKVTKIPDCAFRRCDLTEINIPNSVTSIGVSAFYYCTNLKSIKLGNSLSFIGKWAFSYTPVSEVVIPGSVKLIEDYAFSNCQKIKSITIEGSPEMLYLAGNPWSSEIEILNLNRQLYDGEIDIEGFGTYTCTPSFAGFTGLTSVNFGENVTNITDKMFSGCTALRSVTIPSNISKIGEGAFSGCSNLKSINIEDCNDAILINSKTNGSGEGSTFAGAPLETLYLGRNVEYSGSELSPFKNKTHLTTLTIGNKTTAINDYLFYGCTNIAMLAVPSSVKTIGEYSFYDCNQSRALTISKSVESIGKYAFYNCQNLRSLTIPGSVVSIGDYAFRSCSNITSIRIGDKVETIGDYAFLDCYSAETITLGKSVKNIGVNAFYNCQSWSSIEIPNSVESIGNDAFALCINAKEINIGNGVEKIGLRSFTDCENLTKLTIGKSVKEIGDMAFFNCDKLSQVYVAAQTPPAANETVFSDYSATLYVPNGKTDVYIEDTDLCWHLFNSTREYAPAVSDTVNPDQPSGGDDDAAIDGVDSDLQDAVRVEGNSIIAPEGSVVYDLNGRRVKATNLAKGIYIVRLGSKAVKVRL